MMDEVILNSTVSILYCVAPDVNITLKEDGQLDIAISSGANRSDCDLMCPLVAEQINKILPRWSSLTENQQKRVAYNGSLLRCCSCGKEITIPIPITSPFDVQHSSTDDAVAACFNGIGRANMRKVFTTKMFTNIIERHQQITQDMPLYAAITPYNRVIAALVTIVYSVSSKSNLSKETLDMCKKIVAPSSNTDIYYESEDGEGDDHPVFTNPYISFTECDPLTRDNVLDVCRRYNDLLVEYLKMGYSECHNSASSLTVVNTTSTLGDDIRDHHPAGIVPFCTRDGKLFRFVTAECGSILKSGLNPYTNVPLPNYRLVDIRRCFETTQQVNKPIPLILESMVLSQKQGQPLEDLINPSDLVSTRTRATDIDTRTQEQTPTESIVGAVLGWGGIRQLIGNIAVDVLSQI
jgi:hypothetical protein